MRMDHAHTTGGVLIRTRVSEIRELVGDAGRDADFARQRRKLAGLEKIVETDDDAEEA